MLPFKKTSFFTDKKEVQRSATALGYVAHVCTFLLTHYHCCHDNSSFFVFLLPRKVFVRLLILVSPFFAGCFTYCFVLRDSIALPFKIGRIKILYHWLCTVGGSCIIVRIVTKCDTLHKCKAYGISSIFRRSRYYKSSLCCFLIEQGVFSFPLLSLDECYLYFNYWQSLHLC